MATAEESLNRQWRSQIRFFTVLTLLAGTALFLHAHSQGRGGLPQRRPLASFPRQLGEWVGTDLTIAPDVIEVLGSGDFLLRTYQRSPAEASVELFVAYFPSQSAGEAIHSPKNCLPGSGWEPVDAIQIQLSSPGGPAFPVNRYIVAKGKNRQLVLYWYFAHDRAVASEYWAKFYLMADSVRLHRTDGALIRLITPLGTREPVSQGQKRIQSLVDRMLPGIDSYIPH